MHVGLDTETDLIAPGRQAPPLVVVSLAAGVDDVELVHHTEAEPVLAELLADPEVVFDVLNGAYDFAVIAAEFPSLIPAILAAYDADRICDVGIRQKLADLAIGELRGWDRSTTPPTRFEYSLAALVKRALGIELPKPAVRLEYGALRGTPLAQWSPDARQYAADDAAATYAVREWQDANILADYLVDASRQARAALWLQLMQARGLETDPAAVAEFEARVRADYDRAAAELVAAGLKRPDRAKRKTGEIVEGSRDTKAAAARLVAAFVAKGEPHPVTEKGAVCLDDDACRKSGDPVLVRYADFGSLKKRLSTDVPLLNGERYGMPIHARFEVLLETGRTSSSPNVQNLPRPTKVEEAAGLITMRECFVPRPGFVFAAADYSQMELHTLAQVCLSWLGHSRLAEVLNADKDPHTDVAAQILGRTYEDCVANKKEREVDDARQAAKIANFGFPGGLGPTRLVHFAWAVYHVEITETAARRLKAQWLEAYPEMRDYFARINSLVGVPRPTVVQPYSGRVRGGVTYCEACNSPFQGLAADAAKNAGWLLLNACFDPDSPLCGSRIVNFIHDEFILEVPEDRGHEAAYALQRIMLDGARPCLPDVPPHIGSPVLMRRWSKKAEPMFKDGRLIPWERA